MDNYCEVFEILKSITRNFAYSTYVERLCIFHEMNWYLLKNRVNYSKMECERLCVWWVRVFVLEFSFFRWTMIAKLPSKCYHPSYHTPPTPTPLLQWKCGILVSVRLSVCGWNRVCAVSSTICAGSISYLYILATSEGMSRVNLVKIL